MYTINLAEFSDYSAWRQTRAASNRGRAINPFHEAIYLTGPTASGKSAVGVALARRLDAEIVAMDSMTLYRGMDIGTAKPGQAERADIPHHLLDVLDPWESTSVAEYRAWALAAAEAIMGRGRRVLFVGGTALYLKTLLRGLFEGPSAEPSVRQELEAEVAARGAASLHHRLSTLDPAAAARIHPNDARRIVRALEVIELTGVPLSQLQREHEHPAPSETLVFALDRPRPSLYERINRRVLEMFDSGFVEEVRVLQAASLPLSSVAEQGVGYREVIAALRDGHDPAGTIERIQIRSRQFAKRQATWFRGLEEVRLWPLGSNEGPEETAEKLGDAILPHLSKAAGR